jgi:uncharacterized protein (DUF1778 family)
MNTMALLMPGEKNRHARIELKTTPDVKLELEQAAAAEGVSLTAFIISQAVEHARSVMEARQITRLNETAFAALSRVIKSPAPATVALKDLMQMED